MKDVVLEEKIDKIITEELGIANGVVALADKIEKIIYQLINNGVESREFSINTDFFTVNVNFTHKDFYNQNEAEKWMTSESINKYSQQKTQFIFQSHQLMVMLTSILWLMKSNMNVITILKLLNGKKNLLMKIL